MSKNVFPNGILLFVCLLFFSPALAEEPQEPFFLTDKAEYTTAELIKIEIRFPYRGPIYFVDDGLNSLPTPLSLEVLDVEGSWSPLSDDDVPYQPEALSANDQFWRYGTEGFFPNWSFQWDQIVDFEQQLSIVPGTYRFRFVYYSKLKNENTKVAQDGAIDGEALESLSKTIISSEPFVVNS